MQFVQFTKLIRYTNLSYIYSKPDKTIERRFVTFEDNNHNETKQSHFFYGHIIKICASKTRTYPPILHTRFQNSQPK